MIPEESGKTRRLSYNPEIKAEFLPFIRLCRNQSQHNFANLAGINPVILCQIEAGKKPLSNLYLQRIRVAMYRLRVSGEEIECIKRIIAIRNYRGY